LRVRTITVECRDPYRLVAFWSEATGFAEDPANPNERDDPEGLLIAPDGGLRLLFIKVPEPTGGASRLRLDLTPQQASSRDEEVDRLLKMGATIAADHREADSDGWVLLADPEGNEFSVARRPADEPGDAVAATATPADQPATGGASWLQRLGSRASAAAAGLGASRPFSRISREIKMRFSQLIRLVLLLVEALIALRMLFKVTGANEHASFASLVYRVTSPLVSPFHPVFADHPVNGHPFEVGSLLAMGVYAAAAYVLLRLVRLVFTPRS
jgi:uncharacterized protein YggT (Ycf19 family)